MPIVLAAIMCALPATARGATHTWTSGVGDDVNPCSRVAPCRTLQGALAKTDAGGVVSMLDASELESSAVTEPVTITRAVTIEAGSKLGELFSSNGTGIIVQAGATESVVIRGLILESSPDCVSSGSNDGILFSSGHELTLQGVAVRGYSGFAVNAQLAVGGSTLSVSGSDLRDNCGGGLSASTAAGQLTAAVSGNLISGNGTGVLAGTGAQVHVGANTIVQNTVGMDFTGKGELSSLHDNHIASNGLDVRLLAPPPVLKRVLVTPAAPKVTPPSCVVPNLLGKTLTQARRALAKTKCALGTVTHKAKAKKRRHAIYLQQPKPGTLQLKGALVNLTINTGGKSHKHSARAATAPAAVTWVSGVGDNLNPCTRTAPCKTFAGALAKTAAGGTINALDPGNFEPVTVTQSVTIQSPPGTPAIIVAPAGTTAVTIAAPPNSRVILRNLTIISGAGCSEAGSGSGIDMLSGGALHLEDLTVSGFAASGIALETSTNSSVTLSRSQITNNCATGVSASATGGQLSAVLQDVEVQNGSIGIRASGGALVQLSDSGVSGASVALAAVGGGLIEGWPDNDIGPNSTAGITPSPLEFS